MKIPPEGCPYGLPKGGGEGFTLKGIQEERYFCSQADVIIRLLGRWMITSSGSRVLHVPPPHSDRLSTAIAAGIHPAVMKYVRVSESPPDGGHFGPTVRAAIRDNIQGRQEYISALGCNTDYVEFDLPPFFSPLHRMPKIPPKAGERGSPCPSVLPRTECARHEVRPQGRRKTQCRRKIFGIEGHPEGDAGGEVFLLSGGCCHPPACPLDHGDPHTGPLQACRAPGRLG